MTETENQRLPSKSSTVPSGRGSTRRYVSSRRGTGLRRLVIIVGTLVLLAVVAAGWLIYRADQVKINLDASMGLFPQLQTQLVAGDAQSARRTLAELEDRTTQARVAATDPVWKAASILPVLGTNLAAVSEVAVSADDVVSRAVAPLVGKFETLDWEALTPADGKVDLAPLEEASPSLNSAANTVQLSFDRLAAIDAGGLMPQVAGPLTQATEALSEASVALNNAAAAAAVLPPMLGADESRNYLVLIQNSAEVRATGGISGAMAVIRTNNGAIELTGQGSATDIGRFRPPLEVDPAQELIYSFRLGAYIQDVNLTPDFPTAARTAKAMWEERNVGTTIDGVIALDPVVLANILQATGPVEIDDPKVRELLAPTSLPAALAADNVVDTLLSKVYSEIEEPALQDAYFAAVAGEVFGALAAGQGESDQLIRSLIASSEQNRLFVWSNRSEEQDVVEETPLASAVTGSSVGGAAFGLYFNDGTGAKMDYYVRRTAQLIQTCQPDGYSQFTVKETITNTAPADAADSLPAYVTGGAAFGVPAGNIRTNHVVYGPAQSLLLSARIDGEKVSVGSFRHGNRPVGTVTTELAPGESVSVEVEFGKVVQVSEPQLDITPTVQSPDEILEPLEVSEGC